MVQPWSDRIELCLPCTRGTDGIEEIRGGTNFSLYISYLCGMGLMDCLTTREKMMTCGLIKATRTAT